jgi:CheY-like chemotaxis protein
MTGESVLIVEDEGLIALHLSELLEQAGYRITGSLFSGEEALRTVSDSPPDIILMDIALAGQMDGIEAARRIRLGHDIPVIFLSAYSDENRIRKAAAVSPYRFLTKPVREEVLLGAIADALAGRHS